MHPAPVKEQYEQVHKAATYVLRRHFMASRWLLLVLYLFLTLPFSYGVLLVGPLVWLGLFLFYPKGHKLNRSLVRRAS